jgi:hypothetical protein
MLITFFDVKGILHFEFIPQGQTPNPKLIMWKYRSGYVKLCLEKGPNCGPVTEFSSITMLQPTTKRCQAASGRNIDY